MPRWFYYAVIDRESGFNPNAVNRRNNGLGLTQLTGEWYNGMPYPENLATPDDFNRAYRDDMNFKKFGMWIRMTKVSPLTNGLDPRQNLDRFSTGYAVPAFHLFKRWYGLDDTETLRAVAFHWNRGVYKTYDPNSKRYLGLYDKYVRRFKPIVEAQDGVWNGRPVLP